MRDNSILFNPKAALRPSIQMPFQGRSFGRFTKAYNEEPTRYGQTEINELRLRLPDYLQCIGVDLNESGERLVGLCPLHNDNNPSFAVFGDDWTICGCYPCDFTGGVFDLAIKLGHADTFPEAVGHVKSVLADGAANGAKLAAFKPKPARTPRTDRDAAADKEKIDAARRAFVMASDNNELAGMFAELGIPPDVFRSCATSTHGLGLLRGNLTYIYPSGMKVRHPKGQSPRFHWEIGKASEPWRFDRVSAATHTIYLTEGETDCLALLATGLENDPGVACVAAPGTGFPKEWAELFSGKNVVVCFDNDDAGADATRRVCELLVPYAASVSIWKGGAE